MLYLDQECIADLIVNQLLQLLLTIRQSAVVRIKLVTQPVDGQYLTTISSDGVRNDEAFPEMSIQIPSELIEIITNSDGNDGVVRAVSYLYYNVEGLFPNGLPGENECVYRYQLATPIFNITQHHILTYTPLTCTHTPICTHTHAHTKHIHLYSHQHTPTHTQPTCTNSHLHTHTHTYIPMQTHNHIYTLTYTPTPTNTYVHLHLHTDTHTHTHPHLHTQPHLHTHVHTCIHPLWKSCFYNYFQL